MKYHKAAIEILKDACTDYSRDMLWEIAKSNPSALVKADRVLNPSVDFYSVTLLPVDPEAGVKIHAIKACRALFDLGLKEAKELVDSAPVIIKERISMVDAEIIRRELKAAGASVRVDRCE